MPVSIILNIADLESATTTTLPDSAVYVTGYAVVADGGEGLFAVGTTATANGGTIINDASGRSWYRCISGSNFQVEWFGAKGNGTTDDTAAFNATLVAATAAGKPAQAQSSKAGYVINGSVTIPTGGTLLGATQEVLFPTVMTAAVPKGPWLLLTNTSLIPFTMQAGTVFRGFAFYWPNQTDTNPPVSYPYAVYLQPGEIDFVVEDMFLVNCFCFLLSNGGAFERLHTRNIRGTVLSTLMNLDGSIDTCRIEDTHIWPFWPVGNTGSSPSRVYTNAHAIYLNLGRNDALQVNNFFSFGGNIPILMRAGTLPGASGSTSGQFSNVELDSIANAGFDIQAAGSLILSDISINSGLTGTTQGILNTNPSPAYPILMSNILLLEMTTGIQHNGNQTIKIANLSIINDFPGLPIIIAPATSGYTSVLDISNGIISNGNGGTPVKDGALAPAAGASGIIRFSGSQFVGGGATPSIDRDGPGSMLVEVNNWTAV